MVNDTERVKALVIAIKASYFIVEIDGIYDSMPIALTENRLHLLCTLRAKLRYQNVSVNVGDFVIISKIDFKSLRAVVVDVETRINLLPRPQVANVSNIVVMLSVSEPSLNFDQANRFLLAAEQFNSSITLLLSKKDLVPSNDLQSYVSRFISWGYDPILISIKSLSGISAFLDKINNHKISVLCGPSGVGKSSLLSHLIPREAISIASVSGKLKRGRHTTRNVQLYSLGKDSMIADTPGFNRPEITVKVDKLQFLFPELKAQKLQFKCKFRDCLHRGEPGCEIDPDWDRYDTYIQLLDEIITCHR